MATVPIVSPAGDVGDVPFAQMRAALAAGGKPGVTIKSPDGKLGIVPADRYQDAVKAGGTVVPYQEQDTQHPGFWAHAADLMGGMLHPSGFSPYPGMDQEAKSAAATQAAQQDQARKQAGYSAPYRALAPVAQSVGVNVPAMEQNAKEGDSEGVLAGAAVPLATLGAGEALAHGLPAAAEALDTPTGKAVTAGVKAAAKKLPAAAIRRIPYVGDVAADVYNAARDANAPEPELDATGENKPYAGAPKPKLEKELDATGENRAFSGGVDEYTPPKKPVQSAPAQRTVVLDPESGKPEFSDVVAAKQQAAQVAPQPAASAEKAIGAGDPILERLRAIAAKNEAEAQPRVPEPGEDLTALGQQSLDMIRARKGGVMTTADPAQLAKRWGVDTKSLQSGREQTRGMSPQQIEQALDKAADEYKNGKPVEPVMETRDQDNNIIDADGRFRVMAAQRAGIERVPIMIRRIGKGPLPTLEPETAGSSGQ